MVSMGPLTAPATGKLAGQSAPATLIAKHATASNSVASPAPVTPNEPESERVDRQAQSTRVAELASLRKMVGGLEAQIQALEQEATDLEVELLDQQIAFAKAEEKWKEASVERRVVYNITNIPVGGSVSEERIESDAEQTKFPPPETDVSDEIESIHNDADPYRQYRDIDGSVERWNGDTYLADVLEQESTDANAQDLNQAEGAMGQAAGGRVGLYSPRELSVPTGLPTDNRTRQEVFFGPAEDLSDDWDHP